MINVLHLGHGLVYGGIERVLTAIAKHGASCSDVRHAFALCFDARAAREIREAGGSLSILGSVRASRPWTVLRARRRFQEILRERAIEVVVMHGNWSHGLFGRSFDRLTVRLVAIAHAPYGSADWTERKAARAGAELILANSGYTLGSVQRTFPDTPARIWRYPVDSNGSAAGVVRDTVRKVEGARESDIVVLMACRIDDYKGHSILIDAMARLGEHSNEQARYIKVWIAGGAQTPGEAQRLAKLQDRVRRLSLQDRIRFLGQRENVAELMSAADVFCQPNISPEPFGIVFVEAMRLGLPIVSSRIGGAAEIVDDRSGILTEPGNAGQLANALVRLGTNEKLRRSMSGFARAKSQSLCVPHLQLDDFADAIRRLCGESGFGPTVT